MRELTMSTFGKNGRLGNQMFQQASMTGLAWTLSATCCMPEWEYGKYFVGFFEAVQPKAPVIQVKEPTFSYVPNWPSIQDGQCLDIHGYLQSEKYWGHDVSEQFIREMFTFKPEFVKQCIAKYSSKTFDNAIG